jgi:hypothetical protein
MSDRQPSPKPSFDAGLIWMFGASLPLQGVLITDSRQRILIEAIELAILAGLSLWYRRRNRWKWIGVKFSWSAIGKQSWELLKVLPFFFLFLAHVRAVKFKGKSSFEHWYDWINPEKLGTILTHEWQAIIDALRDNPLFSGMVLSVIVWLVFNLLVSIQLVDRTEEAFFRNCQVPEHGQPIGGLLRRFIHDRPLMIVKQTDTIRLEFPLSPPQELEESWLIALVFAMFCGYGFLGVGYSLATNLGPSSFTGFEMTGEWAMQIYSLIFGSLLVTFGPWFLWQAILRNLFVRRVMEFKPDRLIISDRLWGRDRPKIEIPKMDLQPLRESKGQTTFPGNKLFWIQHRGKDVMLARFLLSTGMEAIQTTYDRYRTTNFAEFYRDTESLNLPLD